MQKKISPSLNNNRDKIENINVKNICAGHFFVGNISVTIDLYFYKNVKTLQQIIFLI